MIFIKFLYIMISDMVFLMVVIKVFAAAMLGEVQHIKDPWQMAEFPEHVNFSCVFLFRIEEIEVFDVSDINNCNHAPSPSDIKVTPY